MLHKTLVVLSVGTAAGERDLVCLTIPKQLIVDELRPVVTIDTAQGKGKPGSDRFQGIDHTFLAAIDNRNTLCPTGEHIRNCQGIGKLPRSNTATVGHKINLAKTRVMLTVFPVRISTNGNLMFEQRSGLGRRFAVGASMRGQETVTGRRTEAEQFSPDSGFEGDLLESF